MMYQRLHEKAVPDMFERSSDVSRHEEALELHSRLGLHDKSHFRECEKEMFSSYPSVLNHVGGSGQVLECRCRLCVSLLCGNPTGRRRPKVRANATSDAVFRQLPNGGRRSPRSALFCYMMEPDHMHHYGHQHVHGLSRAVCLNQSFSLQQDENENCNFLMGDYFDQLSSDSDVNDFLNENEDGEYNEQRKFMRELHDGLRPKAEILTDVGYTPEERAEKLFERLNHLTHDADGNDTEGVQELKSYAVSHFAASGSSHCPILNGKINAVEDEYLSAEAIDEAAADLGFALQRLREGIAQYELIVHNVSRRCWPLVYSLVSRTLSVACARAPHRLQTSAYEVFSKQKQPYADLLNQNRARALCRGGLMRSLLNRMAINTYHVIPQHLKPFTAVAKRACGLRIVNQIIEAHHTQTQNNCQRWMARLAKGSEY